MHIRRTAWASLLPLLLLAPACDEPSGPEVDPRICPQTYEFGNTGCADVTGLVTDTAGKPMANVLVGVLGTVDSTRRKTLASGSEMTDASGHYQLRVQRMVGDPPAAGPDTLSVWISAVALPPSIPGTSGTPGTDSAAVRMQFSPVGSPAVTTEAPALRIPPFRPATR